MSRHIKSVSVNEMFAHPRGWMNRKTTVCEECGEDTFANDVCSNCGYTTHPDDIAERDYDPGEDF
jgi:ribosomal protein L37E